MFVYTVKASRLKFFALIICSMAVMITLAAVIPKRDDLGNVAVVNYSYSNIKTNDDRVSFLEGFGYTVEKTPVEVTKVTIPDSFDSVYEKYNDLQRSQGLNLKHYCGKTVTRYTYKISDYDDTGDQNVIANLLIYNNKIIGGDICRVEGECFIHGFEKNEESK